MKFKIMMIVCFFVLMAAVPMMLIGGAVNPVVRQPENTGILSEDLSEKEIVCQAATSLCDENFNDEAIKAVTVLVKNNYNLQPESYKGIKYSSKKEIYTKVKNLYNSDLEIRDDNLQQCFIPYSDCSNGFTYADSSYTYLDAVASPWDCYSENYNESNKCIGVSLSGIKYLCDEGLTAEEALRWYLPKLSIT